jgi:membrane protein YdbS with pleckstrin-like domain
VPRPLDVVATRPGLGRHFAGQLDEQVIFSRHPSPYVLLRPARLLLLDLALLGALVYWQFHIANGAVAQANMLHGAEVFVAVLLVPLVVYWLARGAVPWLAHVFVLTNQRLIEYSGVWRRTRKQLPLEHIQQVRVERPSFLAALLDLGDVIVLTASEDSDLRLAGVRAPRAVADAIVRMRPGGPGSRPSRPVVPEGLHPTVQALIEQVTGQIRSPEPSEAIESPDAMRRAPIRLLPGEQVLTVIHRHWYLLLRRIFGPLVLLLAGLLSAAIVMALAGSTMSLLAVVLMLGSLLPGLVWGVLAYINYIDDIFILTTDRIVDIERRYFLLAEARREAPYDRIQDVRVKVEGSGRVLGFGALTIETAGRLPDIDLRYVPQAFAVQDLIFARINALKERSASSVVSRQRDEYAQVMASTINQLLVEVPDIRGMSVLEAGERIRAAGLAMVVRAQQEAPGVPPGLVIAQAPGAGTLEVRGNEVVVVLSGRATPTVPAAPLWPVGG